LGKAILVPRDEGAVLAAFKHEVSKTAEMGLRDLREFYTSHSGANETLR
jgi:hypothetical protein